MTKFKNWTPGKTQKLKFWQKLSYGTNQRVRYWQNSKTQVILKLKTQIWTKHKKSSQEKLNFWQQVFELEQLKTLTNDAI